MGRFRGNDGDDNESGIDISPLLDCVFILLIFFIVTTTFVDDSGIEVDKPSPSQSAVAQEDKPTVIIELLKDGKVLFNGENISLNLIRQKVRQEIGTSDDIPAIVKVSAGVPVSMTTSAVDQAKFGGATAVLLAPR